MKKGANTITYIFVLYIFFENNLNGSVCSCLILAKGSDIVPLRGSVSSR